MPWIKLDDQIGHHPKILAAGPVAAWLWVCGTGYCNKYLTDGEIPDQALSALGGVREPQKHAKQLVEAGLWERTQTGYTVHDFHDHNPTAKAVKKIRKKKQRAGRLGGILSGKTRRKGTKHP